MTTLRERSVCVELAMEGERLCKSGDCRTGVQYFEEAVRQGTDDLKALSAIYSQLGNAYFYLQDYNKAMEYHQHDRTLARSTENHIAEAKASGNLANTLKMLGRFEEAIACCDRHLEISRELNDKVGEARALYNLGNVYHLQGKQGLNARAIDQPPQHPEEAVELMRKAIKYYEDNLVIVQKLCDRAAQGRAYGSLGNTNYLLGNYRDAIKYHRERLAIAKEFGDKPAERRAYSNLGNAHVLLGEYESAADFYKRMLNVTKQLNDRSIEAQACYSLGNTYSLIGDHEQAIEYHMKHWMIAQEVKDRVGECKACWSLSNAHISLGNHEQALEFSKKQLAISEEVGDETGRIMAENNLRDLKHVMSQERGKTTNISNEVGRTGKRIRRTSMEHMEILRLTPEQAKAREAAKARTERSNMAKDTTSKSLFRDARPKANSSHGANEGKQNGSGGVISAHDVSVNVINPRKISPDMLEDDNFFDLITRLQGRRMDDQRCVMRPDEDPNELPAFLRQDLPPQPNIVPNGPAVHDPQEGLQNGAVGGQEPIDVNDTDQQHQQISNMINMLANSQSKRMNEQRVSLNGLPGLRVDGVNGAGHEVMNLQQPQADNLLPGAHIRPRENGVRNIPPENRHSLDDTFFNALMRCQSTRLNDQRSSPPIFEPPNSNPAPTVPDEDFFALIVRMQSSRIEDQRCGFSPDAEGSPQDDIPPDDDQDMDM